MSTCTGQRYPTNPDAPEEGHDIHHDGPCPAHPTVCKCGRSDTHLLGLGVWRCSAHLSSNPHGWMLR